MSETIEEVKERIKKEIKEQSKKLKVVKVNMRYKDYMHIKRGEKQKQRRAEDYILNTWPHEVKRSQAQIKRDRKNKKRLDNNA